MRRLFVVAVALITAGTLHVLPARAGSDEAKRAKPSATNSPAAPATDLFDPNPGDPYAGPITRTGPRMAILWVSRL